MNMALTLRQLLIIWVVCSANYETLTNLAASDFDLIDNKAGLPSGTAVSVIAYVVKANGSGPKGATPLELASSLFQATAANQNYVPPVGGKACGSVTEILSGF
jgi:hypothetical protein